MGRNGKGLRLRDNSIQVGFTWAGKFQRHTLMTNGAPMAPTAANVRYAERLVAEIREKIRLGTFSLQEYFPADGGDSGQDWTLGQQLEHWLKAQKIAHATRKTYTTSIRFWKAALVNGSPLGEQPLRAIRKSDLMLALATKEGLTGKTINNYTSVLRQAIGLSVDDKRLTENPADLLKRATHQKDPPDPFTQDEAERIIAHIQARYDPQAANYIEFRFFTGLRPGEAIALQWGNVDLVKGEMLVKESVVLGQRKATKTEHARMVKLNSRALAALQRQKSHTYLAGAHVFHDPAKGTAWAKEEVFKKRCWVPTLRKLEMRWRPPYNARHTYATLMLMAGMRPAFCARQMGHAIEVFLNVYARWLDGDSDDLEMRRLEAAMAGQEPSIGLELAQENSQSHKNQR